MTQIMHYAVAAVLFKVTWEVVLKRHLVRPEERKFLRAWMNKHSDWF